MSWSSKAAVSSTESLKPEVKQVKRKEITEGEFPDVAGCSYLLCTMTTQPPLTSASIIRCSNARDSAVIPADSVLKIYFVDNITILTLTSGEETIAMSLNMSRADLKQSLSLHGEIYGCG